MNCTVTRLSVVAELTQNSSMSLGLMFVDVHPETLADANCWEDSDAEFPVPTKDTVFLFKSTCMPLPAEPVFAIAIQPVMDPDHGTDTYPLVPVDITPPCPSKVMPKEAVALEAPPPPPALVKA